tara:strand:- start:378 stop:641 length:264 start_codon:yes stop_codon:yes gene_type:complete
MITEDDEFERLEREIEQRKNKPAEKLSVVYTIKLSKTQRIKLMQLGGPKWIRNQIERSTELRSLGEDDTGQVCPGCLHPTSGSARGA